MPNVYKMIFGHLVQLRVKHHLKTWSLFWMLQNTLEVQISSLVLQLCSV